MKQKSCDLIINKHFCEKCDYKTDKKSSFDKQKTRKIMLKSHCSCFAKKMSKIL